MVVASAAKLKKYETKELLDKFGDQYNELWEKAETTSNVDEAMEIQGKLRFLENKLEELTPGSMTVEDHTPLPSDIYDEEALKKYRSVWARQDNGKIKLI